VQNAPKKTTVTGNRNNNKLACLKNIWNYNHKIYRFTKDLQNNFTGWGSRIQLSNGL
jgi:tRNA(Ile)-lysidine synthase TilS/MesJ